MLTSLSKHLVIVFVNCQNSFKTFLCDYCWPMHRSFNRYTDHIIRGNVTGAKLPITLLNTCIKEFLSGCAVLFTYHISFIPRNIVSLIRKTNKLSIYIQILFRFFVLQRPWNVIYNWIEQLENINEMFLKSRFDLRTIFQEVWILNRSVACGVRIESKGTNVCSFSIGWLLWIGLIGPFYLTHK